MKITCQLPAIIIQIQQHTRLNVTVEYTLQVHPNPSTFTFDLTHLIELHEKLSSIFYTTQKDQRKKKRGTST